MIMDVKTGGLLGITSKPDYDLNNYQQITDKLLLSELELLKARRAVRHPIRTKRSKPRRTAKTQTIRKAKRKRHSTKRKPSLQTSCAETSS